MLPAILSLSGPVLTADERALFRACDPAGYILFGRNVVDRAQLRALTDDLRALHGRDRLFIAIDQEGGRVARMKPPVWEATPPQGAFAQLYDLAPASAIEAARLNAECIGLDCAEAGVTVDCLPLLDCPAPGADTIIGDRAFGTNPLAIAALGRAVLDGLARAGVAGVIKHIPGHGRAMADSHLALPVVDAPAGELERDLGPFRALAHAAIGMTAHVRFTAWDDAAPATLSPRVIGDVVRGAIGFSGLLLTDDLDMAALQGEIPDRAERALAAGCDLALYCWARLPDMAAMAERLPPITAAAAQRLACALEPTAPASAPVAERRAELAARRDALLALTA